MTPYSTAQEAAAGFQTFLSDILSSRQGVDRKTLGRGNAHSIPDVLTHLSKRLQAVSKSAEADALDHMLDKITQSPSFGGLGLSNGCIPTTSQYEEALFLCEAWIESDKSQELSRVFLNVNSNRAQETKPITLTQKIFTQYALGSKEAKYGLALGEVVRVGVDWVLASELSWIGMAATYEDLGDPGPWRNDRFWIAGDHRFHPTIANEPKIKAYVEASEKAKKDFRMTEYQGMNYTIMHTEVVRERAEPGMLSDSTTSISSLMLTEYTGRYTINIAAVESSVAIYPRPDDVVPVSDIANTKLDGVFIGACTTTEEELVLAALVLKVGLAKKLPLVKGKRHYVPGSLPIVQKLHDLGLLQIYEEAGFTRGPPGRSMCVGLSAEKAAEGETWLSSQNRNFKTEWAKDLSEISLRRCIDVDFFQHYQKRGENGSPAVEYVEPRPHLDEAAESPLAQTMSAASVENKSPSKSPTKELIRSKVVTLGDLIDTDALALGPTLTTCKTDEEFGQHVLEHTHPDFRAKVAGGQQVVVAGRAFGVGSSRECAVSALKGAGVQAVIAHSFAFIYSRKQPSLGLLGIAMEDEAFFEAAKEGVDIAIDIVGRTFAVSGQQFSFRLSNVEHKLTMNKGILKTYNKFGKAIWQNLMRDDPPEGEGAVLKDQAASLDSGLNW